MSLLTTEHIVMFVVKFIVIQILWIYLYSKKVEFPLLIDHSEGLVQNYCNYLILYKELQ